MASPRDAEQNPFPPAEDPRSASAEAQGTSIDLAALHRATGGDEALKREVVTMFVEQLESTMEVIRRAVAEGNADTLRHTTHTLLGSCTTLGALTMAELVAALERAAESEAFDSARKIFADLVVETARSLRILEQSVLSSG